MLSPDPAPLEQSKPNRSITATTQMVTRSHPGNRFILCADYRGFQSLPHRSLV